jgi:hypothetical protein
MALFDSIYVLSLAAWIGSSLFLSLGAIPLFLRQLATNAADDLIRALIPRYCVWGAICGAMALTSVVAVPLCFPEYRGARVALQAAAIISCLLITLYLGNTSMPLHGGRGRHEGPPVERGSVTHRRASRSSALVAVTGTGLLVAFATRASPRSSGIVELTPAGRARYDAAISRVIEQIEVKYGFRDRLDGRPDGPQEIEPPIDPETVKEIDSYYARKRRKENSRAGRATPPGAAHGADLRSAVTPPSD